MNVAKGSFTAVAGDATATKFQLSLSELPDQVLYFTNRLDVFCHTAGAPDE